MIDLALIGTILFAVELPILCLILYYEYKDWVYDTDLKLLEENLRLFKKNNEYLEKILYELVNQRNSGGL